MAGWWACRQVCRGYSSAAGGGEGPGTGGETTEGAGQQPPRPRSGSQLTQASERASWGCVGGVEEVGMEMGRAGGGGGSQNYPHRLTILHSAAESSLLFSVFRLPTTVLRSVLPTATTLFSIRPFTHPYPSAPTYPTSDESQYSTYRHPAPTLSSQLLRTLSSWPSIFLPSSFHPCRALET
jgi:hypothetical protein